jgi:hypothetical protein
MTPRYICILLLADRQNRSPEEQSALMRLSNGTAITDLTGGEQAALIAVLNQVSFNINLARGLCLVND